MLKKGFLKKREHMNRQLKEKINESLRSALPITVIVLLLSLTITPMPSGTLMLFLVGAVLLILGIGIFTLGADMSMLPVGEGMGVHLSKSKKVGIAAIFCFLIGIIITIAEPDLQVLADQIPSIEKTVLILTLAIGVGIFLIVALLRIYFHVPLRYVLIGSYALAFLLSIFAPNDFLGFAFDAGAVTTGPIVVPFIMAVGIGLATLRSDKSSKEDSFGLVALCCVGPILAVLILSILYNPSTANYHAADVPNVLTTTEMVDQLAIGLPTYIKEVAVAVLPIILLFGAFQLLTRRFHKKQLQKMVIGLLYTYVGLVLFLTGVNVGFLPVGHYIGMLVASEYGGWVLIALGAVMGYFIVEAEPAVHILKTQVEELSNGMVSQKAIQKSLSIGVGAAVALSMVRVLTGISVFYFLIPGYVIALAFSFFVPSFFTAVAFDAGGVATGPMTATFLLPFAIGATQAVGGNVLTDTFGLVAMIAIAPPITIQVLGFLSKRKQKRMRAYLPLSELQSLAQSMVYYGEGRDDA